MWLTLDSLHTGQNSLPMESEHKICAAVFSKVWTGNRFSFLKPVVLIVLIDLSDCDFSLIYYCEYKLETKGSPKQFHLAIKIFCH